jgi:ABC-2 type transport system ATP-binding protein
MKDVLKTESLTKDFGDNKGAFDINLELSPSEIVGFIGPNGAGKTTTMLMLAGFTHPTSGFLEIFNRKEVTPNNIHTLIEKMGVLLSEIGFDPNLSSKEIFQKNAWLLGKNLKKKWQELSERLDLDVNKTFGSLSLGNKKKAGLVNALMHSPKLLIMDEPTAGLDPLIQQEFLKLLREHRDNGASIMLSSHILKEVENICDRIIMIKNGRIILTDKTSNILEKALKIIRVFEPDSKLKKELKKTAQNQKLQEEDTQILIHTNKIDQFIKVLDKNNHYNFFVERVSLEEMFLDSYK